MSLDLVYLQAPGGTVIGFTLPLGEHVEKQWRAGELARTHEDGSPWDEDGDDPDTLAGAQPAGEEPAEPGGDAEDVPVRPRDSAHVKHWREYAVALGCPEEEAAAMTKAQAVAWVTPPEELPPDPEA